MARIIQVFHPYPVPLDRIHIRDGRVCIPYMSIFVDDGEDEDAIRKRIEDGAMWCFATDYAERPINIKECDDE